ncbi:MAG: RNA polymerase subunit sigma-70 [Alphaproteobacteria bacterium PA3]|nr:MAG: RNA polymerase subunit sigma-70 [Alphaproteobacteria bacterium PA3]
MPPATALEEAYVAQRERLLRFLRARGAGDAAEDLLQDLWLRLAAAPDPEAASGMAYMMRAADRLMIDRYRSEQQAASREKAWAGTQPGLADNIAPAPGPERAIAARQQVAAVQQALDEVGTRPAAMFRRHRIDGVSQPRIAEEFGVSLSTVESDLRRVYAKICDVRRALDEG